MARKLGYGGLGNTNGARSFSGKEEVEASAAVRSHFAISTAVGLGFCFLFIFLT